jgi:hypothetical protein
MCEHPKKDLANGDRFVEPFQDFSSFSFFNFIKKVDSRLSQTGMSQIWVEVRQDNQKI